MSGNEAAGVRKIWRAWRELLLFGVPVVVVVLGGFWLAAQYIAPAVPRQLVLAASSAGSPYYEIALRYRQLLKENGVELVIRESGGSIDNLALINDPTSGVSAAFIQGGLANSSSAPELESIGRLFYEPVWLFTRGPDKVQRLTELQGKRILIGPAGSATAAIATRLLAASGITPVTATLLNRPLPDDVGLLDAGEADAAVLVLAPEARTIQRLLEDPQIQLLNLSQADAYVQRFPFLERLELKQGVVDFARNIPPSDSALLTTTAALVVRDDLHPALVSLLTQAAIKVHREPRLNPAGEARLFQRAGEFPQAVDQEFPLAEMAARVYRTGPPFLQRYLPFWLATLIDRLVVLLLPVLGILLPVVKFAPELYVWRVRRRIMRWYRELQRLEETLGQEGSAPDQVADAQAQLERIDRAVCRLPVPLSFANQLFDLREHIHVVRRRLAALTGAPAN